MWRTFFLMLGPAIPIRGFAIMTHGYKPWIIPLDVGLVLVFLLASYLIGRADKKRKEAIAEILSRCRVVEDDHPSLQVRDRDTSP